MSLVGNRWVPLVQMGFSPFTRETHPFFQKTTYADARSRIWGGRSQMSQMCRIEYFLWKGAKPQARFPEALLKGWGFSSLEETLPARFARLTNRLIRCSGGLEGEPHVSGSESPVALVACPDSGGCAMIAATSPKRCKGHWNKGSKTGRAFRTHMSLVT